MNTSQKNLHDRKLESLASAYRNEGYVVLKSPTAGAIPFDLDGYSPDLVAMKDDAGLIIEVKASASGISVDRLQWLAQEISTHAGWRFLLLTLEDVDTLNIPLTPDGFPTWSQLLTKLKQVERLIGDDALEPAVLYLWSVFEGAMRKRAIEQLIPVDRLASLALLNHMYSQGEISVTKIDFFRDFMGKRNRIAHGANMTMTQHQAQAFLDSVSDLLSEWTSIEARQVS
ncbi:MAG: hypothetical protein V4633_10540 [Pseudomonadota bacterium]